MANKGQAKGKQGATNNNDKNENNNKDLSVITDGFDHWWSLYPVSRHKNKKGCLVKFKAKCKNLTADEVVDLTNKISNDIEKRVSEIDDIKFLPATEPYLTQERWNDYD